MADREHTRPSGTYDPDATHLTEHTEYTGYEPRDYNDVVGTRASNYGNNYIDGDSHGRNEGEEEEELEDEDDIETEIGSHFIANVAIGVAYMDRVHGWDIRYTHLVHTPLPAPLIPAGR